MHCEGISWRRLWGLCVIFRCFSFVYTLQLFSFAYGQKLLFIDSFFQSIDISLPYMLWSFCDGSGRLSRGESEVGGDALLLPLGFLSSCLYFLSPLKGSIARVKSGVGDGNSVHHGVKVDFTWSLVRTISVAFFLF